MTELLLSLIHARTLAMALAQAQYRSFRTYSSKALVRVLRRTTQKHRVHARALPTAPAESSENIRVWIGVRARLQAQRGADRQVRRTNPTGA